MPIRDSERPFKANFLGDTLEDAMFIRQRYKGYITGLAYSYSRNSGVNHKDLISEGFIGLARAVRDFRSGYGKITNTNPKFHQLAVLMIKEALKEAVYIGDSPIHIPTYLRETHYYLTRISNILGATPVGELEQQEITFKSDASLEKLGVPEICQAEIEDIKEKIANIAKNSKVTYETLVDRASKIPRQAFIDIYSTELPEAAVDPDEESIDRAASIGRISDVLSDREYDILMGHLEGITIDVLKDRHQLSSGRVSQILNEAKEKLESSKEYIMTGVQN